MTKFKVVIVGGGTAGWLSALFIRERMPDASITVVESEAIGILGAGEGTTPAIVMMLDDLKIPLSRLIKETSCTIKNGIKFTNWRGDGTSYFHGFGASDEVGFTSFDSRMHLFDTPLLPLYVLGTGKNPQDLSHIPAISEAGKVPLYVHPEYTNQVIPDPIHKYIFSGNFAVHFDAAALANFLKKVATEERGIVRVEGKVTRSTQKADKDLEKVILDSNKEIEGDFFIDCTGFAKKFIGEIYKSEWVSHKKSLTVDSAIPFFLDIDPDNIAPYTEAVAMKHGWMWKIPLQHRIGCGYVFDSSYITSEDAKKEIVEYLGEEPTTWPRETPISFDPGYYSTPWVNNCISFGLSGGFIEPLEATSIWGTLMTLRAAFKDTKFIKTPSKIYTAEFNKMSNAINESIFNFVYYHYMGGRTDTQFWSHYQNKKNIPKSLKAKIAPWEERTVTYKDFKFDLFTAESWVQVGAGLGALDVEPYEQSFKENFMPDDIDQYYEHYLNANSQLLETTVSHKEFLRDLKTAADLRSTQ